MNIDTVIPKLRVGRIYLVLLFSVLIFDLPMPWESANMHDVFSWVFDVLMTLFFPPVATLLARVVLTPSIDATGISLFMRPPLSWSAPCRAKRIFPGWFVLLASPSHRTGLPMGYLVPGLPLVRDGASYVQALHRFAPAGHPVLKHFPLPTSTRRA